MKKPVDEVSLISNRLTHPANPELEITPPAFAE